MTKPPSAWTISNAIVAAQSALSRLEAAGDVETDEAALLAILREEAPDVDEVIVRLVRASEEAKRNVAMLDEAMTTLEARQSRYERRAKECRTTLAAMMDALGIKRWHHAEATLSVQPGRPGVVITDESALPESLMRVKREPDRSKIKAALEAGEDVPGAALANGMPTLVIRTT